jgi:hypothetical protein
MRLCTERFMAILYALARKWTTDFLKAAFGRPSE